MRARKRPPRRSAQSNTGAARVPDGTERANIGVREPDAGGWERCEIPGPVPGEGQRTDGTATGESGILRSARNRDAGKHEEMERMGRHAGPAVGFSARAHPSYPRCDRGPAGGARRRLRASCARRPASAGHAPARAFPWPRRRWLKGVAPRRIAEGAAISALQAEVSGAPDRAGTASPRFCFVIIPKTPSEVCHDAACDDCRPIRTRTDNTSVLQFSEIQSALLPMSWSTGGRRSRAAPTEGA